jgi:hypothetical protein
MIHCHVQGQGRLGSRHLPSGSLLWYHSFMAKKTVQPRKKRGPPATGKGTPVQVRMQPEELAALDAWITTLGEKRTRPAAIRRLVEIGLKAKK